MADQQSRSRGTQYDTDQKVDKNVTLPKPTLEALREEYPLVGNDAEAIRRAIADGLELRRARAYSIERSESTGEE